MVCPIRVTLFLFAAFSLAAAAADECPDWVNEVGLAHAAERAPASMGSSWGDARLSSAHSHNDYEQPRPLQDALDHRFESVEADVWHTGGVLRVSHSGWDVYGTLKDLYLEPLQKIVKARGSVYGDGRPFYLWIDIKYGASVNEFADALHRALDDYPMLTVFTDTAITPGPVTVILTGNGWVRNAFYERSTVRRACRDRQSFSIDDPPADNSWKWYSLSWNDYFSWDGKGRMPLREATRLKSLVDAIHAKGRRIRFFHGPETDAFWRTQIDAGVDLVDTGELDAFRRVYPATGSEAVAKRNGSHGPG